MNWPGREIEELSAVVLVAFLPEHPEHPEHKGYGQDDRDEPEHAWVEGNHGGRLLSQAFAAGDATSSPARRNGTRCLQETPARIRSEYAFCKCFIKPLTPKGALSASRSAARQWRGGRPPSLTRKRARVSYLSRHSFGHPHPQARFPSSCLSGLGIQKERRVEQEADGSGALELWMRAGMYSMRPQQTPFFQNLGQVYRTLRIVPGDKSS